MSANLSQACELNGVGFGGVHTLFPHRYGQIAPVGLLTAVNSHLESVIEAFSVLW